MKYFLFFICCFIYTIHVSAQPGLPDQSFGENGKVVIKNLVETHAMALQRDEKIISVGMPDVSPYYYAAARFNTDGSLDESFGDSGFVVLNFGLAQQVILSVVIQKDNKVLLAGFGTRYSQPFNDERPINYNILLARLMPDGTFDSTFGINGMVNEDFGNQEQGIDVKLQSDGNIVVAGNWAEKWDSYGNFMVARYQSDGRIDKTFGNNGIGISFLGSPSNAVSIDIQNDGKIILGGGTNSPGNPVNSKCAFTRYLPNGTPDDSFGNMGKKIVDVNNSGDGINEIKVTKNGNILAGGYAGRNIFSEKISFLLLSLNSDGSLNREFGDSGIVTSRFSASMSGGNAMEIQDNGKILMCGGLTLPGDNTGNFLLARYLPNGSIDSVFGDNGIQLTSFGYFSEAATDIEIQRDGKIITCGNLTNNLPDSYHLGLARYHGDPVENPVIAQLKTWLRNNTLGWYTSNNSSVNYYSVQRSANGIGFTEEKRVQANNTPRLLQQANTREQQTFTYALNTAATNSYYRVAAVLKDGSTAFSPVVYYGSGKNITLYPNPVKEVLTVKGLQPR